MSAYIGRTRAMGIDPMSIGPIKTEEDYHQGIRCRVGDLHSGSRSPGGHFAESRCVMRLLRRGAELDVGKAADVAGSSLDHVMGTWSTEEADLIDQALEDFSRIDETMWK